MASSGYECTVVGDRETVSFEFHLMYSSHSLYPSNHSMDVAFTGI